MTASTVLRSRRDAICEAVYELLAEVGYDRMTMDGVAERARASKATIYRMWPDKPRMVAEALTQRFAGHTEVTDTGSLRGDLLALMRYACGVVDSSDGDVISGVMTAAAREPALAAILHECIIEQKKPVHATLIRRAAARGEIPAETDPALLHEVMHAMVLSRKLWGCQDGARPDWAEQVVDDVLMPILNHPRS